MAGLDIEVDRTAARGRFYGPTARFSTIECAGTSSVTALQYENGRDSGMSPEFEQIWLVTRGQSTFGEEKRNNHTINFVANAAPKYKIGDLTYVNGGSNSDPPQGLWAAFDADRVKSPLGYSVALGCGRIDLSRPLACAVTYEIEPGLALYYVFDGGRDAPWIKGNTFPDPAVLDAQARTFISRVAKCRNCKHFSEIAK